MHVFVTACLQQDASVLCAHRKCVRGLQGESQSLVLHSVGCGEWGWIPVPYLEHGLLVLTVLHLGLGEVEYGPLNRVLVRVVDVDIRTPDHHEAFHPSIGVRLQEVQVALFGDDGTAEGIKVRGGIQTMRRSQWKGTDPLPIGALPAGCPTFSYLTRISWMSGTSNRWGSFSSSGRQAGDFFCSPSTTGSRSGLTALEEIWGGLGKEEEMKYRKSEG